MKHIPPSWLWAVISGWMVGASFPPSLIPVTALPGLVVFLLAMRTLRNGSNPAVPILLHMVMAWGWAFSWVGFHSIPHVSTTSVLVLAALIMAATAACTAGFRYSGLTGLVAGYLLLEGVLTFGPVPMPWVSAGFTVSDTIVSPSVQLFGIIGTSVMLWTVALVMAGLKGANRIWLAIVVLAMTVILTVLGHRAVDSHAHLPVRDSLSVRIVQPDMTPDNWADVYSPTRMDTLRSLSRSSGPTPDLTVWPETALPALSRTQLSNMTSPRESSASFPLPLLTGGIVTAAEGRIPAAPWNAAILFEAATEPSVYAKQELVPFAEYVPASGWVSALSMLAVNAGGTAGYTPGNQSVYWTTNGWSVAPMICFESVFAALARRHAREGADVLVVLSQTGWWSWPRAAEQHMAYSTLAAQSVGLPMIVSSVNGPSGVIDAYGRTMGLIPQGVQRTQTFAVPTLKVVTPYSIVGEWPVWIIFGVLLFTSVRIRQARRTSSDT